MADADLYLDTIDFSSVLSEQECKKCGADSCRQLVEKLAAQGCTKQGFSSLSGAKIDKLKLLCRVEQALPVVPSMQLPQPGPVGLVELNEPRDGDPVLMTGNSRLTQEVLSAVLSTTISPFYLLCVDTNGDTLDMALILGSFTAERVIKDIVCTGLKEKAPNSTLILPGLAREHKHEIEAQTGFPVRVGPICAVELAWMFGDSWRSA